MKAIIFAGGKGTRLLPITSTIPKPLIMLSGKSILERAIYELPDNINTIYIVLDYLSEKFYTSFLNNPFYLNKVIFLKIKPGTKGTHAALCAIKDFIKEGELFYIQNGDDIFAKEDIEAMIEMKSKVFAVGKQKLPENYWVIKKNEGLFGGFRSQTEEELNAGGLMGSGAYILDKAFFDLPVSSTANGETSIPHTLRDAKENYQLKIFTHQFWITVNNHEELAYAKEFYKFSSK